MKKDYYLLFALFTFFFTSLMPCQSNAQSLDWAQRFSRDVNTTRMDYVLLPSGDVIVIGAYDGRVIFEGVSGRITIGPTCSYCWSGYVARLNNQGKTIWYKNWSNTNPSYLMLQQVELDDDYNIVIGGAYKGAYDLDPDTSVNLTPGGAGLFLIKLDTNGSYISASSLAGLGSTDPYDYSVDHLVKLGNRMFMAGEFESSLDLDPTIATQTVSESNSDDNIYFALYDSSMQLITSSQRVLIKSSWTDGLHYVPAKSDGLGNVYLVEKGLSNGNSSGGDVLRRYNQNLQNDSSINLDNIYLQSIEFFSPGQLAYVGRAGNNSDFGINGNSIPSNIEGACIAVYDSNANLNWKYLIPDTLNTSPGGFITLCIDGGGNTIVGGSYSYDLYLDSSSTSPTNIANTSTDGFFASFDQNGRFNWTYSLTSSISTDSWSWATDLRVLNDKLYIFGGVKRNVMDFDPFPSSQLLIPNRFSRQVLQGLAEDPFMLRIDLSLPTTINEQATQSAQLGIYPNPAENFLNISNPTKLQFLRVYSLNGQMVMDIQKPSETIDVSHLDQGIYIIELTAEDGSRTMKKIVKQ